MDTDAINVGNKIQFRGSMDIGDKSNDNAFKRICDKLSEIKFTLTNICFFCKNKSFN